MTVTFAEKLASIPGYVAGAPAGKAPESIAEEGIAQLASNESPWGPHPDVVEVIARAAAAAHRYPDPSGSLLRRRIAERFEIEPGSVALANGSCEVLLAGALALCEPGAEIVYAWPSFSIYPYLAPLSGAREIRVPLADDDVHDLDAMLTEITAATQLVVAGLRVGYGIGSAKFRAAVDAVRQPFSVNAIAQAAAAEAIRHGDDVTRRVERTIVERVTVQEGVRDLGLRTPDSHANFSWIELGDADEADVVAKLGEAGILVRPGTPLGGPGHIRVSYGTPAENQRFLQALADAV
jgi:histidinol-phosphate/aromatic aminotransferase/cobyric acid decarboxylase-like protein